MRMVKFMDSQLLTLAPRMRHRRIGDEGVLINLDSSKVLVLSEVGLRVVELLNGSSTLSQLVTAITEEFEVGDDQARSDIGAFLSELEAEQVLLGGVNNER